MEQTLGKRIVANRKRLNLTQDQLAEQLGVTAQAVSKWENDQSCPDISMLPRLAEIFGISTDELLGREAPPPTYQGEVVEEDDDEAEGIHVQKGGWEFRWDAGRKGALTFAFLVLLVGGLTLAARILSWDVSFWSILWPSAFLVYGLKGLLPRFSVFSFGVTLIGAYYLIENLGVWSLNLAGELVFPIVIVLFGLGLLIDALRKPKNPKVIFRRKGGSNHKKAHSNLTEEKEHFDCSVSFSENTYTLTLPRLSSGDANVSFGELTLDLTECGEIIDGCHLDLSCSFGELRLLVPRSCRVVPDVSTAFGSADITGHPDPDATAKIYVDGSVSFGEIDIQYV